ncbi:hypothetical protein ACIA8O_30900 [Kitasatospora sp. NPDC051853]|uniref:hypothetical protein n=1 Tax=Kitasatospora sp. NPDC051853 TaxID=3364058 RepID=UPI00378B7BCA
MFRSSAPLPPPELPGWPELLREFGCPAAALARPRPTWLRLAGSSGTDGTTHQLDLDYYEDHTLLVRVTTHRVPPPLAPDPAALLLDFLPTTSPSGPLTPATGTGWLFVDGSAVEGRRLTHHDHVLTIATIAAETVAVASTAVLHDEAVHLTFHTPPLPA